MALRHIISALLIILINTASLTASAQRNYPVRATVQYTPPYSLFLGDYATPKLIVTLTGQDLLDANCPFKLSISLECQNVKITTKPSYTPAPLYISGGQTIVLTGANLAQYFDIHNLDFHGITAAKYLQDGQLPEGFYRMNVKVLNYKDNRQISNTAFVMFNARMGKPPVLSLPKDKSLIPPNQQVMPITFSWIPKTVGAYQYRFELWECAVPGIPVQTVVSTVRPLLTQTTFSPMLTLHTATLNMKPGTEYAWRITIEDPQNQQRFANQGRSEIRTFTYKRKPEPVTGLRYTNKGLRINWTWDMDPAHTKYYFEYYDPQTGRTIDPVECDYAGFTINMPSTGYHLKARVRAECYGDPTLMSDYTPYLDTYLEPIPVPEYECGKVFPDREITNLELKHSFAPGEIVESKNGDTRYEIIYANEKDGYLSGQFFMIMDCWGGAKIRCEFSKTQINTDNIVLKTIFHSVTDSTLYVKPETIRKEVQEAYFNAATVLTDFSIKDTVKLDKPYTYLYVNESGKVMAVTAKSNSKIETEETQISATTLKENTLVQGKNGEELVITKKGQVMGKTEFNATGGNGVLLKEYHRKSDSLAQWQINFSKYDKQTYAFDHIASGDHGIFSSSEYYPQSGSYDFRYKSVECGKTDKVKVEFDTYPQADSVVFKDKYGVTYPVSLKDNVLTFTGVSKADTNYIYAYRGDKKIGKLFLNTYQKKTYKVVLVSVNGATLPNKNKLEDYLNKVYNQCAVSFVDSTDKIKIDDLKTFSHGGSGILTVYNDDQKKVLRAYDKNMKDNTYYLFFVDGVTDKKDGSGTLVSGYMPRGYNCGFIYDGGSPRTIAHELGHGIAGLEHVFADSKASGKTQNLMDYATGEQLWHFQWDQIQDPTRVWMKWNRDEGEGENVIIPGDFITIYNVFGFSFATFCAVLSSPLFDPLEVDLLWANMSNYAERKTFNEFKNLGIYTPKGYHDLFPDNNHIHAECGGFQKGFGSESHEGNDLLQILKKEPRFKDFDNYENTVKIKDYDAKSEIEVKKIYQTGGLFGSSNVLSKDVSEIITKMFYGTITDLPRCEKEEEYDCFCVNVEDELKFKECHFLSKNLHNNILFQKFFYKSIVDYIYNNINNKTALSNIFTDAKLPNFGLSYIPKLKNELSQDNFNIKNIDLQQVIIDLKKGVDILYYDYYGLMGATQKLELDLDIYKRVTKGIDGFYYVADIKLTIQDWYGADFEDFFTSIKSKFDCLNAFFVLQHKFGCKPFKTTIIYHDYVLFKKNE